MSFLIKNIFHRLNSKSKTFRTLLDEFIASGLTTDEDFEFIQELKNLGFEINSTEKTDKSK